MALRIPTRTADRVTVISYLDDAIDFDHPDASKAVTDYIESDTPDFHDLPMIEGVEPTKFIIRPLSERELAIVDDMAKRYEQPEAGDLEVHRNSAEANYQILRMGLADVVGFEGWTGKRERLYSAQVWTLESVQDIDRHTAEFLALTIRRWSQMQKKTKSGSISLPAANNGTRKTRAGRGRSTAKSVKSTKSTQRSTAAGENGTPGRVS